MKDINGAQINRNDWVKIGDAAFKRLREGELKNIDNIPQGGQVVEITAGNPSLVAVRLHKIDIIVDFHPRSLTVE